MQALTDVCLLNRVDPEEIMLLVQEDKQHLEHGDPEPQLFAQAVAAFQFHKRLLRFVGQLTINFKVIPGIIMTLQDQGHS